MKYAIALSVVLAVVAIICDSSIIKASSRGNLNEGFIGPGDRILYSSYFRENAGGANVIQARNVTWRGNSTNIITAIRATEVGATQNANATIIAFGIRYNNVTVRFQSARGRGYYYLLQIYGR